MAIFQQGEGKEGKPDEGRKGGKGGDTSLALLGEDRSGLVLFLLI